MSKNDIAKEMDHIIYNYTLHNTIFDSNKYISNGNKKTKNYNARIFYYKYADTYIMD